VPIAPLREVVEKISVYFHADLGVRSTFSGRPTNELDEAWKTLIDRKTHSTCRKSTICFNLLMAAVRASVV
jgi:hypothetical protein